IVVGWSAPLSLGTLVIASLALVLFGVAVASTLSRSRRARIALEIERRAPQCRNVLVTADELLADGGRTSDYVRALVWRDAGRVVNELRLSAILPSRRPVIALAASFALWMITLLRAIGAVTIDLPNAPTQPA